MKRPKLPRLLELKSITFGFTIFYFVWTVAAWLNTPVRDSHLAAYDYHLNVFMAALFFVAAAAGLVLNRTWSKLLATILCGQMPLAFVLIFWITAHDIDAMPFSPRQISRWFSELWRMPAEVWLWFALSSIILLYAVSSLIRADRRRVILEDYLAASAMAQVAQAKLHRLTTPVTSAGLHVLHHADANPHRRAVQAGD
jgi:hypothetical protein